MQRAQYTDEIQEDRVYQAARMYDLLPNNKFASSLNGSEVTCVLTSPNTTIDELQAFCSRQRGSIPVYVYNRQRDGEAWLNLVLHPFAESHPAFCPVLVIETGENAQLRSFMGEKAQEPGMCVAFRGMFVGKERPPFDLPGMLRRHTDKLGTDYFI